MQKYSLLSITNHIVNNLRNVCLVSLPTFVMCFNNLLRSTMYQKQYNSMQKFEQTEWLYTDIRTYLQSDQVYQQK